MEQVIVRYASALVSIARDEKKLVEYKEAINSLLDVFAINNDLMKLLSSYFVKDDVKYKVIDELCSSFELDNLSNFLKLLVKKHIIYRYKEVAKEINKRLNEELNTDEGFVYSTEKLSKERISDIEKAISKKLGHPVELRNKIDERLIGGVKVIVHDHVYDGSIKNKLETLKENLNERRNG